ncbi:DUF1515 family protein [Sinorhizobium sp. Sb3]|uniref:DUF1515 family protein n=1 Tax=Sinorhizobium/Ensifer group TaxID=227292 RepID=UPI0007C8231E|nr:DUF1515 family protein [Sinorhizobium sp. Sb3]
MAPTEIDAAVHRQLGELVAGMRGLQEFDRVGDLEASVSTIDANVAEMKPVTDDVKRWKLMGIGALGVTGIAAMALGVSFAEAIRLIVFVILGKV